MGILDNFEAWVNFDDEEPDDNLALQMFKECVCDNCGCKEV